MKQATIRFLGIFLCMLGMVGCVGTKHLEDGEKLLYYQSIEGIEQASREGLSNQILLKPNNRIPILGSLGATLYERGENRFDTAAINRSKREFLTKINQRINDKKANGKKTAGLEAKKNRREDRYNSKLRNGNFAMKTGTPLAVYDSLLIKASRDRMERYLNDRGFSKAKVEIEVKERGRKVYQKFIVQEGPQSYIDSLNLRTGDPAITKILEANQKNSFLRIGDNFDVTNFENERNRINDLLRNQGYFEMTERFIEFEIRFAPNEEDLWVTTIINKPANKPVHTAYKIDSVIFNSNGTEPVRAQRDYENVHYTFGSIDYSPKALDSRLIMRPGETYVYNDIVNTQRQLLNMNMFRFVNINFDTTLVPGKFVTNIYTAPLRKFQLTQELGVNVSQGVPGPFYNLSLINRNTFKGLEILQVNAFIGSEGLAPVSEQEGLYRSFQYGVNIGLTFPRFLTPFPSRNLNLNTFNPRTTVSFGYSFTDRPEYVRRNLNGTFAYNWQNLKGTKSYTLNLADVNLIDTVRLDNTFRDQLEQLAAQGNTLNLAFNPSFVSSTSFNAVINDNYANPRSPSSFFRYFLEAGGTLYNFVGTGLLRSNGLEFYQFLKFEIDYRRYLPGKNGKALVYRIRTGVANPYADNNALPYEKFFFAGGSSSNRAWNPRRLGPGSSVPFLLNEEGENATDAQGNFIPDRNSFQFEQPGEVLLDLSVEYRANLASFFDWAVFVDAGNVWRLNEFSAAQGGEVTRISTGGEFKIDRFYKEIAVGAGLGLRLDFSFLVFRLDVGHKVRDPRFNEGSRWKKPFSRSSQTVWNIAVGYPF